MSHKATDLLKAQRDCGAGYGSIENSSNTDATEGEALLRNQSGAEETDSTSEDSQSEDQNAQEGVQQIEAITSVWTTTALKVAYVLIWIIYFLNSLQQGTTSNLTPWVTSAFKKHSLTPTVNIVSNIVGGVFKLTLAKILDVFGRPQGYLLSVALTTVGLIVMATCQSVDMYAAAQVFYWVGYNGLEYCLSIFVADTSSLQNRGLMFAYASSPYIITAWISGPLSQMFLNGPGFRWGFGVFAILTPCITLPLFGLFMQNNQKARQKGLITDRAVTRSLWETIVHYAQEFDMVGLGLLSTGLAFFLLPFECYSREPEGWRSSLIIGFLVTGILLLVAFATWEHFYAPVKFIPYALLSDRTVLGACTLAAVSFASFFTWDSYFLSFLQVVNGLSVAQASYVGNIYSIGCCIWAIVVGLLIRRTGKFKWLALYFGLPLLILGVGLMIKFRQPDVNISYIIMCQVFIAIAGGTLVITEQTAVMAAASHQYVAVILAVESMFAAIGAAVGLTVSAAIWQAVFSEKLREYLPESAMRNFTDIYGRLDVQLSYPMGSPTRIAIQKAYGDGQRAMLIGGTAVLALAVVAVAAWRDINVKNIKQVQGNVI
ncbi:Major facilitator superfamily domain, general substrate transporter [Moelleriella libera RCEF 2490]|uniref:Major facilitator superfamily domain, general substrate transporter n=1 Tax=Moelleriella libera RCEF 2490 TaxID=1081109 RepID=A0A168B7I5_9HYPO|nr:Major facilitator superfamily domain, general substrate transporter [Moelleriella libera RCEF 2490]